MQKLIFVQIIKIYTRRHIICDILNRIVKFYHFFAGTFDFFLCWKIRFGDFVWTRNRMFQQKNDKIQLQYHQIVTFCDFLGNFRKLSTKNTTKLENSSDRYGFFAWIITIWRYLKISMFSFYLPHIFNIFFDVAKKIPILTAGRYKVQKKNIIF